MTDFEGENEKSGNIVTGILEDEISENEKFSVRKSNAISEYVDQLEESYEEQYPECKKSIIPVLEEIEKKLVRDMIFKENKRLDGRKPDEIRPIECEVGLLPRTHGSSLFTRGQTQAFAATTLGTKMDEQKMDELEEALPHDPQLDSPDAQQNTENQTQDEWLSSSRLRSSPRTSHNLLLSPLLQRTLSSSPRTSRNLLLNP